MKVLRAAALVALLAGPTYAQMPDVNLIPEIKSKTPEEKEADEIRDKAYRDSLRKIPDAKVTADPWGAVRSVDAAKTAAPKSDTAKTLLSKSSAPKPLAPAKPKIKTGATEN